MKKILSILTVLFISLSLCGCGNNNAATTQSDNNSPQWIIAEHEYGEKYPYNEYYLELYCYKEAVWFEDSAGNQYSINGIAKSLLKNNPKYKGGTEKILKNGMLDLFTPTEAMNRCYKLSDGEYEARKK